jgi:5'-nucleotidase
MNDIRETLRSQPLRIGISTRSLFNLEEEHAVFVNEGVQAYAALQLDREDALIEKGPGFEVVERLLRLNEPDQKPMSRCICFRGIHPTSPFERSIPSTNTGSA